MNVWWRIRAWSAPFMVARGRMPVVRPGVGPHADDDLLRRLREAGL